MWAAAAAAGRATKMLERNVSSILRPTKGMDLKIKRGFCSKSQEGSKQNPEVGGHSTFKVPGHKPSDWEKKVLLWSGRFKKVDDIPETISLSEDMNPLQPKTWKEKLAGERRLLRVHLPNPRRGRRPGEKDTKMMLSSLMREG
nr:protein FAM162A isoform X3 [Chrysemys picta bellii]